jgi:hypothetical protein
MCDIGKAKIINGSEQPNATQVLGSELRILSPCDSPKMYGSLRLCKEGIGGMIEVDCRRT